MLINITKKIVIVFITGVLIGAIIATAGFLIFAKFQNRCSDRPTPPSFSQSQNPGMPGANGSNGQNNFQKGNKFSNSQNGDKAQSGNKTQDDSQSEDLLLPPNNGGGNGGGNMPQPGSDNSENSAIQNS